MSNTQGRLELGSILISKDDIERRVREVALEIEETYRGEEVVFVGILKGASIFLADLVRAIGPTVDVRIDFMAVSSYGDSSVSSGVVKIVKDMDAYAEGKHVVLVEDIVDTGLTLHYLREIVQARSPKSLRVCALLEKPERKQVECEIEYKGFTIPDAFVVGYGLDYAGQWRHLPDIWCVVER